ncbi:hypothetical protein D3C75_1314630 [compost metagenome]
MVVGRFDFGCFQYSIFGAVEEHVDGLIAAERLAALNDNILRAEQVDQSRRLFHFFN